MAFSTIIAKFEGTCRRCKGKIKAGDRIRYGGKGLTYHLKADCEGVTPADKPHLADGGEDKVRFNTACGCEDFPCCGCYGLHGRELYQPSEPYDAGDY